MNCTFMYTRSYLANDKITTIPLASKQLDTRTLLVRTYYTKYDDDDNTMASKKFYYSRLVQ